MKDKNGVEVTIGAKAVVHASWCGANGRIGTVRDVKPTEYGKQRVHARVADGPEGDPNWSAWLLPRELVIVEAQR